MLSFNQEFAFDELYQVINDQNLKVVGFIYSDGRATLTGGTYSLQDLSDIVEHSKLFIFQAQNSKAD